MSEEISEEITVPETVQVPIDAVSVDGKNPNRMSREQLDRLKTSIKKFGFILPVVTNEELLIADGEQRWKVAKELGMTKISVVRMPMKEVTRKTLRQVLNKLHGEHDKKADGLEFQDIIQDGGEKDLKYLLGLSDDKLEGFLHSKDEESVAYEESFEIIIECKDEIDQERIYNRLSQEGYKCRVSTL